MLWVLGFLSGLTGLAINILIRILGRWFFASSTRASVLDSLTSQTDQTLWLGRLIGGTIAFFVLGLLFWLLAAAAEAGIIQAITWLRQGQPVAFRQSWRTGFGYLGRLIAIDTIIFIPLFILLLFGLLLASSALFGVAFIGTRPGNDLSDLLTVLTVAGGGVLAVIFLAVPIALLTFLLRLMAFRGAIVERLDARESIGRAWDLARKNPTNVLAIALLLWVIRYLIGLPASLIGLSATTLSITPILFPGINIDWLGPAASVLSTVGIVVSIMAILISAVLNAFSITTWTLAYNDWAEKLPRTKTGSLPE